MPTIHDVAKESGVSISTVSRVIQCSPNVLPETRARVEEVIRRLDYHPNRLAQQFRAQHTKNILVIVPEYGNTFFTDILAGIESVASRYDYSILLVDSHSKASVERRSYEMLSQKLVDGIITCSIGIPKEELRQLAKQYPIVVGIRYFGDGSIANVTIDNIKATFDMTSYMMNLGHKRICYLAGNTEMPVYRDRLDGYLKAISQRGLPIDQKLILSCEPSFQGGYNAISSLIHNSGVKFSAIVAAGDTMAIGAIRALNDSKLRVPDDVAVAGFDDIELSSLFNPTLTTIRQPKFQMGVRAMEKLLDLIEGKCLANARDILNYELVIRESSGNFVGNRD